MIPLSQRQQTLRTASFHDAQARELYASRYRPIGIRAVRAGTRKADGTFEESAADRRELPAVLRDGHHD
jgi:hypothetical protein